MSCASFWTRASESSARDEVMMAMEWCGIIALMNERSCTVSWLRTSQREAAKTMTEPAKIAALIALLEYIDSM